MIKKICYNGNRRKGSDLKAIKNGRIVLPDRILDRHIVVYDEKIQRILPETDFSLESAQVLDARGCYIAPGLINLHVHGCGGFDTMDANIPALRAMQKLLPETGVTAFLPTTMTVAWEDLYKSLENIREAMQKPGEGAQILGAHMEGPFISEAYKGAQAGTHIEMAAYSRIAPFADIIRVLTVAPECIKDKKAFISACRQEGILVSLGHSAASYEETLAAIDAGATRITHLFNAMPGLHHRKPGLLGAALAQPVSCEIITDNVHVHPAVQQILYHCKPREKITLITDSMRACMLGDGISELGGQKVIVKDDVARLADGTIAGSVLRMNEGVWNFWQNTGCSLPESIAAASLNPARELGIEQEYGSVAIGKRADLTLLDERLQVKRTIIGGRDAYRCRL